jgi:hypothetical protein
MEPFKPFKPFYLIRPAGQSAGQGLLALPIAHSAKPASEVLMGTKGNQIPAIGLTRC